LLVVGEPLYSVCRHFMAQWRRVSAFHIISWLTLQAALLALGEG